MSSHFEALLSHLSRGMLFCTRASLMFETHTPPWFRRHLEALSLLILTRLIGNPYSKCKCKLVLGTTKGTFLSFHIKLNRFQGRNRSGVVKGEPWSPPFIVPHSLPNHHSQYPTGASLTLNICPTLPLVMVEGRLVWHAHCTTVQDLETASRHLRALSSAILCIYSFNLFVCNLPQLIAGVFAPPRPGRRRGRKTRAKLEASAVYKWNIFNCKSCFQSITPCKSIYSECHGEALVFVSEWQTLHSW